MIDLSAHTTRRGVLALSVALLPMVADARKRKRKKQDPKPEPIEPVEFSGTGSKVSDDFRLPAGRYKVSADFSTTDKFANFIVHLLGPDDFIDFTFNELTDAPGTYHFEAIVTVEQTGVYFFEVANADGDWHLRIETR